MIKRALFIILLFSVRAFAAGGTCPSGANYINPANPTGANVTLSTLGITSCFFISASGADTNNGTTESTPWLHAPGMPNCSNTCSSTTPTSGEGFIFRGGDTWHFGNSGAAPYTGGAWSWTHGGSSTSSPIYLGIDLAWFTGGSWARPIFTEDNTPVASSGSPPNSPTVASCSFGVGTANNMITFGGLNNWIFDDFEITGYCWNNAPSFGNNNMFKMFGSTSPSNDYFERNYIHGWSRTSGGGQADATQVASSANTGPGWHFWFNVSDGTDSDWYATGLWGAGFDGSDLAYNYIGHQGAANVSDNCHYVHDNLFEYIQNVTDGSTHTDIVFCFSEQASGNTNPNIFYNNVFRFIGTLNSQSVSYELSNDTPASQTDYVFNNISYQAQPGGSGQFDIHDNACSNCTGSIVYWNNTLSSKTSAGESNPIMGGPGTNSVTAVNNHFITLNGTQGQAWQTTSGLTETTTSYMSEATAAADNYTDANGYSPTSSSSPTVTAAGTNETTNLCADSVLHNAAAEAACIKGTTLACSYNSTTHSVSCPDITANPKPATGSWQTGAYEFTTSTYTITISSITGHGTVTSSDSVINCTTGTTGTCSDSTASGTVILTESPASGYTFTGWGGGTCSGTATTCSVTAAATVTASFAYTITISSIIGAGTVTSSDSIINCTTGTTGTCADSTASGTVILTETPSAGYVFAGWGGGTCSGTATTCSVTTTATVTAKFVYTITISSIVGTGTVTSSDSVINCTTGTSGTCIDSNLTGTVTLTETPGVNNVFAGWGGGTCSGTATTCSVTTTATVTATFVNTFATYGTGFGVGYTVLGAPVVTGIATLPQQWATKIIHPNFTTTRTLGAGAFYACTTGDTCFAELQQAYCDWAFDGVDDSWLISIHAGTFAQTGLGHTCTQTGATVYKSLTIIPKIVSGHQPKGWIVFDSDNPLPEGTTVCSHGTDDNATRQPPSGDISTWWNGTNWGCANDYASFWIFEADWLLAGNAGALIQGGQWDATTQLGPANIVFRNAHFRQKVGAVIPSDMVKPSYGNLATMTNATQGPVNWHFENIYATGDATDWCNQVGGITQYSPNATGSGYAVNDTGTISGGTSTATYKVQKIGPGSAVNIMTITFGGGGYSITTGASTTATSGSGTGLTANIYAVAGSSPSCVTSFNTGGPGANIASNMFELSDCINCSLKYSYTDYITRAGAEGHVIGIRRGIGPIAIVHNWLSGQAINMITGGEAQSDPLYYLYNIEYRGNRNTEPPSLIGTGYQGPTGGSGITFKNRMEFKVGQYVLIDGNTFEYSDTSGGQSGQSLELNPRGCSNNAQCDNTQVTLQDFTVTNNIARHALAGFALVGRSSYPANGGGVTNPLRRVNINNNLIYDLGNTNNYDHLNVVTQPYSIRFETGNNAFICNGTNASGTITLTCLHGPPGLSQTNISVGDYFIVQGCSDSTWNVPTNNFQFTQGATALTGTVPGGFTVVYQNNSAVASSATGCVVQSGESHPSNMSIVHNTFIMDSTQAGADGAAIYTGTIPKAYSDTGCASAGAVNSTAITALTRAGNIVTATVASTTGWDATLGTGSQIQTIVEVTGVTPSDFNGNFYYLGQSGGNLTWMQTGANETGTAFGTAAQMGTQCPYNLFAQNITAKDNLIAVNSTTGPSCPTPSVGWNGWLEQGGSNLEGCPSGFNATGCSENTLDSTTSNATYTDFPGRCPAKYTEMGGVNAGVSPPLTLFFPASSVCSGSTATSACVGMSTMMNGAAFDGNDSNFQNYVLDPSSTFHNAADDGTDYGANPATIQTHINSKLYTCASYCGTGPQPDSPQ